jgi:hypothetical protein
MNFEEKKTRLAEINSEALLADGFEEALIGFGQRCGQPTLAVYDCEKCIQVLMRRDGMSREEAEEYLEFNSIGAWAGEHTPIWLVRWYDYNG